MSELSLPEKIVAVHERLTSAKIAHAFGGALALAYYAEPRATDDIDINVFVAPTAFSEVHTALEPLDARDEVDLAAVERDGQCRLWLGRTPLDLFFAYDEIHQAMRREARLVPFGDSRLPILAPEHLLVCKAIYDRAKDWLDIEQILVCVEDLDVAQIRAWLDRIVGENDPRRRRFERAVGTLLGDDV
ncbi:MAG TPA: hypothetical protein VES65_11005 [Solirubrobacteraceae bacterium]|nr:hypothetical protein [Solirubrobacteraceae bacterium]